MRTTRAGLDELPAPGSDPLGSASRLRLARLDPDVVGLRLVQALVDAATATLLVAVPVLATLLALVLSPAPPVVAVVALGTAVTVVLVGFTVVWPAHDGGRTAGMRWTGLRVVDRAGRPPRAGALAVRTLLLPLDLLVGLPLVLVRTDRRRLGDLLAGTQVVRDLSPGLTRPHPARRRRRV